MELSPRETQVLQGWADGMTNGQIAEYLGISVNTVKSHAGRIFIKLDVGKQAQAVALWKESS